MVQMRGMPTTGEAQDLVDMEAKSLEQAFVVADMHCSGNPDDYLPASHACFFTIDMPKYTNAKSLKEKLLFARRKGFLEFSPGP